MDSEGHNSIAGVSIFLPEGLMDWEGFGLQNVGFDVNPDDDVNGGGEPMIPEPASWAIWLSLLSAGSVGLLVSRRHRNDG